MSLNKKSTKQALLAATCVSALLASPAYAQDTGEDNDPSLNIIVVTAQSREQSLQDVPLSVVAVGGEELQDGNVARLEDLQTSVPNFNLTETGIATNIFIRGVGSGVNQGFEQSVGTYIDGVYYGRAQSSRAPFLDLERIEVLRGPQTILFGKNSIGGALNITTAKPTDELEGYLRGSYEFEDGETVIEGAVSGGLADGLRARVAARYRDADGYYQNLTLNRGEAQREDFTIRGQLEADITDNLEARLKVEYSNFDVIGRNGEVIGELPGAAGPFAGLTFSQILVGAFGADPSVLNNTFDNVRSSNGDTSDNETQAYQLTLDWALGDYDLQSITAYTKLNYNELCDCDFTGAVIFDATLQEQFSQFSQELRLTSPVGDTFDFITGLYFQTTDHDYSDNIIVPANSVLVPAVNARAQGAGNLIAGTQASRIATVDSDVYSAFAQINWHLSEEFTIQLGGRLTHETKDGFRNMNILSLGGAPLPAAQVTAPAVFAQVFGITSDNLNNLGPTGAALQAQLGVIPVMDSRKETQFTPDIKLQYQPNSDVLLYGSYARGVKSGGFDFRANNRGQSPTLLDSFQFDTETANAFEVGGKFTFAGGRGILNVAGFFTDFSDLQISIFDGILGFNVGNAASAEIKGIEVDGRFAITDNVTLSGAFAWTDFEFTDFTNGQCFFGAVPDNGPFCDYTGNSQQMLSDISGFVALDVNIPVANDYELNLNGSVNFASEYDASATYDPALVQGGFAKLDLRASFSPYDDRWEIAVLGKNLTNKQTINFGGDVPLAGNSFGVKSNYSYWSQGRTIAVQLGVKF